MNEFDILHFEQLKNEVQAQYLVNHTPSFEDISKWKGIDIIYFQEDLRKIAKGNISEKSFYTYFKSSPVSKLPRIDMLNILSIYVGYVSWYDFKKNHQLPSEIAAGDQNPSSNEIEDSQNFNKNTSLIKIEEENPILTPKTTEQPPKTSAENIDLQNSAHDNQNISINKRDLSTYDTTEQNSPFAVVKKYLWLGISVILAVFVGLLGFKDDLFSKKFYYSFSDADRNSKINAELQLQILRENESPILYTAKPNEQFVYTTKSKTLRMVVSSPYYRTDTIYRNLETAPEVENIELKPNDYAQMLYFYTRNMKDLKRKRVELNNLISDDATIFQVFDNDTYGVETMDKQRYISLVTLPTTSLENLEVIEIKNDKFGKISMIKFKIISDEKK